MPEVSAHANIAQWEPSADLRVLGYDIHRGEHPMRNPLIILPVLAVLLLTACETVKGVGRDFESTGEAITDSSRQVQNDM